MHFFKRAILPKDAEDELGTFIGPKWKKVKKQTYMVEYSMFKI